MLSVSSGTASCSGYGSNLYIEVMQAKRLEVRQLESKSTESNRIAQDKADKAPFRQTFSPFQVSSASATSRWSQGGNVTQTLEPLQDEVILKSF